MFESDSFAPPNIWENNVCHDSMISRKLYFINPLRMFGTNRRTMPIREATDTCRMAYSIYSGFRPKSSAASGWIWTSRQSNECSVPHPGDNLQHRFVQNNWFIIYLLVLYDLSVPSVINRSNSSAKPAFNSSTISDIFPWIL
jgi:hypothetical protein